MGTPTTAKDDVTSPPKYGLKVRLNHVYPENRSGNYTPSLRILWSIIPLVLRYLWYYIKYKLTGKSIVMDYMEVLRAKQIYGVPIGGIGCGTIGRGFRGEFCRFQLKPGLYEYNTVEANQFIITIKDDHQETIFHSLLSAFPTKSLKSWTSLIDPARCRYTGLYPRSWTEYDLSDYGIRLTCRQISPVIPHDYTNSSLPCAVFVWNIENVSNKDRTVTIAFTFKNGTGTKKSDRASTCSSKSFSYLNAEGVVLYHTIDKMPCSYALAAKASDGVKISKCLYFDPNSDGSKPWIELKNNGGFEKLPSSTHGHIFGEMGCGIAAKVTLAPSEAKETVMDLVWDMPTVNFPGKQRKYNRFYTEWFGMENAVLKIVDYAFNNYNSWEQSIYNWQKDVLSDSNLPDWYKSALFNESYFISDGGTVWFSLNEGEAEKLPDTDPRRTYGRFGYLEGHEYKMYNSYDVHFYASHALHKNWPYLQKCLHYDLRDSVFIEIPDKVKMLYDGVVCERKVVNSVPHDAGDPGEEPFQLINSYPVHDVSSWRDLGPKFVLQSYRDAFVTPSGVPDKQYVQDMYNACYTVMHRCLKFDVDDDGLIENSGAPDQTFDTWIMTGASAYCGGLWLAACAAMVAMSDVLGKLDDKNLFEDRLMKGKKSYDQKLWNGLFYNFDCSKNKFNSIMADQLCGQWYLRCCGVGEYPIVPKENVRTTLQTIYQNNVLSFCNGNMGAVNGFVNGDADDFTIQSLEVWTGVTYALAAAMIQEDMLEEAFRTAGGLYKSMTESFGLAFSTPEAVYAKKYYRSIGYMRPLSIWSMQLALEQKIKKAL
ncbi:hypothetical protein NQ315_017001 [Exocentrus adspersus]|uniref:Non-lysosomal glucosylceramidase n=1 Tax=Exocentrus adspersus TaxID=1586481 RepID=A0AAV8VBC3_9CUCU|nr:hypothetical protein NQ315_017001 [Exocentrus adspersus]